MLRLCYVEGIEFDETGVERMSIVSGRARRHPRTLKRNGWLYNIRINYDLYIMVIPGVLFYLIFHYGPMLGVQIAFRDYIPSVGIWNSDWVGMKNFNRFFQSYQFTQLIGNTLAISVYQLLVGFPFPILLAIMLNEVSHTKYKKVVQMVTYAPHFISLVVIVSMMHLFFGQSDGFVNNIREAMGLERLAFMGGPQYFRHMYVWSGIWQGIGWNSIIFISALAGVPTELHEAATVEGANKPQRIRHIDLPHILPTAIIMLILNTGSILSVGFEKVFLMQNQQNLRTSQVISTYVYKMGLENGQFSFSAAVGLFNSVVTFVVLVVVNQVAKRVSQVSLF